MFPIPHRILIATRATPNGAPTTTRVSIYPTRLYRVSVLEIFPVFLSCFVQRDFLLPYLKPSLKMVCDEKKYFIL